MTQSKINEKELMNKWAPIIESMGVTGSKADWLSEYANQHSMNENINQIHGTQSESSFPSVMPMAKRIFSKTIGLDLVATKPMPSPGGHTSEEIDKMNAEIKADNREGKIESIIDGVEYEEKTLSDHPDYRGPGGHLFYLDYQYGGTTQSKKK